MRHLPDYAELHCQSNFSFQHGASHPEELVERAAALGYSALALTDECSFAGVVRAHQAVRRLQAQGCALRLIVGTWLRLADGPALVLLACNAPGYAALSRLITRGRRAARKGRYHLTRQDVGAERLDGCVALLTAPTAPGSWGGRNNGEGDSGGSGCAGTNHCAFAGDSGSNDDGRCSGEDDTLLADLAWLRGLFPEACWLTVSLLLQGDDAARRARLERIARHAGVPLVATGSVLMHDAARRPLADVLTALRLHTSIAEAGLALAGNAERRLQDRATLARRYPPALLAESLRIAERCRFSLDALRYQYPEEVVPAGHTATSGLGALVEHGLVRRYTSPGGSRPVPETVRSQVARELALIAALRYEAYFLTVYDIVRFARSRGILCQGRGSAANSVVCWALGITEVSPETGTMLFERFISAERNEPPDIDVDFEHERREEVIQYIYTRYGRERAALAATVIRYQPRSALRDVGRALGFPEAQIDRLARDQIWFDGRRIAPERLIDAGLDPESPMVRRLTDCVHALIGFPRHLSQHVGGFVIARGRLDELVPVENAAMPERTVIQWDKDDLDAMGLLKVDVLALGMLTALRRSLALLSAWQGRPMMGLADIPQEDPAVYAMLSRADSIGVFQVESRAQMTMLPRLRPRCFYDLVVEVAIVRPGPIQGGMVHPYLEARARAARGEAIDYPRPCRPVAAESAAPHASDGVRRVLERTLGVPIFQEQVMQLAVVAAGFTPGEADQLRRSMGAWRRQGELEKYRAQLLDGMAARGYDSAFAQRLCDQIQGFGSYGFPESHAASFALLVYFSAWLKCFHPAAFLCGLLNSQPMGFYSPSQLIQDARRHGVEVRAPDVAFSAYDCTLEAPSPPPSPPPSPTPSPTLSPLPDANVAPDHATDFVRDLAPNRPPDFTPQTGNPPAARLGLRMVKGLGEAAAARIVAARAAQPFRDCDDLALRAALDPGEMSRLARAGALASLAGNRRQALWQAMGSRPAEGILRGAAIHDTRLALPPPDEGRALLDDYAHLGFTLGRHPLALLREHLRKARFLTAREILACADRQLARAAGLVTCRQRPGTAKGTLFVTLEDETGFINVIVRPALQARQRQTLLRARLLGVYGQISRQGEVVHLQAGHVVDHSALIGTLSAHSRDFQ